MQQSLIGMASHPAVALAAKPGLCMGMVRTGTLKLACDSDVRIFYYNLTSTAKNTMLGHTRVSAKQHDQLIDCKEKTTKLHRGLCKTFGQGSG